MNWIESYLRVESRERPVLADNLILVYIKAPFLRKYKSPFKFALQTFFFFGPSLFTVILLGSHPRVKLFDKQHTYFKLYSSNNIVI